MYRIEILDKDFHLVHDVVFYSITDAEKVFDALTPAMSLNKWAVVAVRDIENDSIWDMAANKFCD